MASRDLDNRKKLAVAKLELYAKALEDLRSRGFTEQHSSSQESADALNDEEEQQLADQLARVRSRRAEVRQERVAVSEQRAKVLQCQNCVLQQVAASQADLNRLNEKIESCCERRALLEQRLQQLMRMHVVNDAFHIWYSGPFVTINGFRVGRLTQQLVGWPEINAGLGQAAIALMMVAAAMKIRFTRYVLIPLGSSTKIARVDGARTLTHYNLFSDESFSLFPRRNFNMALKAFLQCVDEAGQVAVKRDPTLQLPYKVDELTGMVGGYAVSLSSSLEDWTRAMKYLLTDVKWLLALVAKYEGSVRA